MAGAGQIAWRGRTGVHRHGRNAEFHLQHPERVLNRQPSGHGLLVQNFDDRERDGRLARREVHGYTLLHGRVEQVHHYRRALRPLKRAVALQDLHARLQTFSCRRSNRAQRVGRAFRSVTLTLASSSRARDSDVLSPPVDLWEAMMSTIVASLSNSCNLGAWKAWSIFRACRREHMNIGCLMRRVRGPCNGCCDAMPTKRPFRTLYQGAQTCMCDQHVHPEFRGLACSRGRVSAAMQTHHQMNAVWRSMPKPRHPGRE